MQIDCKNPLDHRLAQPQPAQLFCRVISADGVPARSGLEAMNRAIKLSS
jgi:hypothetical protein